MTASTFGSLMTAAAARWSPATSPTAAAGRPAARASSRERSARAVAAGAGFQTTVLPSARAGPSLPQGIASGLFQGVIAPITPSGTRRKAEPGPAGAGAGKASFAACRRSSAVRRTSAPPCVTGLPISTAIRRASSALSSSSRSARAASTRARASGASALHASFAARAERCGLRRGSRGRVGRRVRSSADPSDQLLHGRESGRAALEVTAGHGRVERVVAPDGVLGDPDREAPLVRVEHGRADAAMEVHARDEERVGSRGRERALEIGRGEGGEEGLRDGRLAVRGRELRWLRMAGGAADAAQPRLRLPVRHGVFARGVDGRHGVDDGHAGRARRREQPPHVRDQDPRRRLQPRGVQEVVLQVDEEEDRPHSARRARRSTLAAMRRPISSVPTTMVPGAARSKVRKPS